MTNYINPFEKRTFSERFCAVFAFAKQNFVQVIKYNLPLFMVIAALFAWFISANPDSKMNNLGSLVNFVCFSYFTHYMLNRGDMSATSFKKMLGSTGRAFVKVFVASIPVVIILIPVISVVLFVTIIAAKAKVLIIVGLVFVLFCLFILYMIPFGMLYCAHYYFSNKFKSTVDAFKESYRMIKGHWWSTFGFILVIGIIGELVVVLVSVPFLLLLPNFIGMFLSLVIAFVVLFFTTHTALVFQYGHLKSLVDECGIENELVIEEEK